MKQASFPGFDAVGSASTAIGLTRVAARARYLEAERNRLLGRVAAARRKQERLADDIRVSAAMLAVDVEPLMAELHTLDREIHALFREILDEPRRAKRARAQIRALYLMLQETGTISRAPATEGDAPGTEAHDAFEHRVDPFPERDVDRDESETAARPTGTGELRALFRRLAEALHPDKAGDDAARAERTEVMKEVTAAYHAGDYSRLLAIEADASTLLSNVPRAVDVDEERCGALERSLAELGRELRTIERVARLQRRSPEYRMVREMKRPGGKEAFLAAGRADVESARGVRDFVASFRAGKIALSIFLGGPDLPRRGRVDEPEDADDEFEVLMAILAAEAEAARPKRRGSRHKTGK